MAIDSDESVSLPKPPPPRPAARREAIDAAMRRFDGAEPVQPVRKPAQSWLPKNRRAFGAFATAAIVAVVSVPVALTTLRNDPPPSLPREPQPVGPQQEAAPAVADSVAPPEQASGPASEESAAVTPPQSRATQSSTALAPRSDQRTESMEDTADAVQAPQIAVTAPAAPPAPPPPPPPPPAPPIPERDAQVGEEIASGQIVVTGSRVGRNEVAKQRTAPAPRADLAEASSFASMDAYGDFLGRLQTAFRSNDRGAVIALIALPLRVRTGGETEIYRSARDIERDFDEIFTPQVKQAVLSQRADSEGRAGNTRVRFTPSRDGGFRIREVRP